MWDIDKLQNAQSKRTKDKRKNIFIKQEKKYIMYTNMMSLQKKKKKKKKKKNYKRNCMKSLVVKPWPLKKEELLSGFAA